MTMVFTACEPEDMPDKGKLDPNATIVLKPAKGVQVRSIETGLTALEVVQNAVNIKWQSHYFDNVYAVSVSLRESYQPLGNIP